MSALPASNPPAPAGTMTVEEFFDWVGDRRAELVDGVVVEYPMPGMKHGIVCFRAAEHIGVHISDNDLGHAMTNDAFFRTGPKTLRGGDFSFVRKGRLPGEEIPDGTIPVAPDLVLEVKSPRDTWMELFAKLLEYLRAGVLVVVFLDPARRTASIYRNDEQTVLLESANFELPDLLPGLSVPVARFFA